MAEVRFRHADQEKWHEVRAIQVGERRASVWEKWLEFTPKFLCLHAKWDPGMMIHRHGHNSDHVLYVLAGEMTCGDVRCTPGMHVTLEQGAAFGPFVAGPQGVELFEVMMGDPRSWAADPDGFERLLREKGARKLPNPPIELPEWLVDTRSS
jgi:quercetin dioxygenase-like cupin family protein